LSQEQVPSLHIQHLPNRLRFTLQQKIARAAQGQSHERAHDVILLTAEVHLLKGQSHERAYDVILQADQIHL
jgi:hypothetical protein